MEKQVGLWIDHHKAVVVSLTDEGEKTVTIESNVGKHVRFRGGAKEFNAEDQQDRRLANELGKYYDRVIAQIRDARSILILGPGEAKTEMGKRLEQERLGERVLSIETADKMTDRQIAARVRERFKE